MVLGALAEPPDPALGDDLRDAVAARAHAWAEAHGRASAVGAAAALPDHLAGHEGPVLLAAPDVPRLDPALAHGALGDLAAGCGLSFAPATDGRPFLLGFPAPSPEALALLTAAHAGRDALFAAAAALGEIGMLRSERRLVTPADARALALDPIAPPELRALAARHL